MRINEFQQLVDSIESDIRIIVFKDVGDNRYKFLAEDLYNGYYYLYEVERKADGLVVLYDPIKLL